MNFTSSNPSNTTKNMAFSSKTLKIRVNSREYSSPIQTVIYPPFTQGTRQCKGLEKRATDDASDESNTGGIRCFGCRKPGHPVYNCREYAQTKRKEARKPVKCFFYGEHHFMSECPKRKDPEL